jgi:hypothetical protein
MIRLGENFILICSETETVAENFVNNIKSTIDERTDLIATFGDKHPQQLQLDLEKTKRGESLWRRNAFITSDNTVVYGIGSGQQTRGRNVGGSRPSLIVVDDMYSNRNVRSEMMREKLNKWFFADLINSLDSVKGKVIWLGTLVHEDIVYKHFPDSSDWFGISKPIIGEHDLAIALTHCKKNDKGMIEPPNSDMCKLLEANMTSLSWKQRYPLHFIMQLYCSNANKNQLDYFYAEYLNIAKDPGKEFFTDRRFLKAKCSIQTIHKHTKQERQMILMEHNDVLHYSDEQVIIAVDIASSESAKSDDTVITAGFIARFIGRNNITGETFYQEYPTLLEIEAGKFSMYSEKDTGKIGMISLIVDMCKKYEESVGVKHVVVEVSGQQGLIARELRRALKEERITVPVREETPTPMLKKEERIRSVLVPVIERYQKLVINTNIEGYHRERMLAQLRSLGAGVHDDYPDSLAYMLMYGQPKSTPVYPGLEFADKPTKYQREIPLTDLERRQSRPVDWEVM